MSARARVWCTLSGPVRHQLLGPLLPGWNDVDAQALERAMVGQRALGRSQYLFEHDPAVADAAARSAPEAHDVPVVPMAEEPAEEPTAEEQPDTKPRRKPRREEG